MRNISKFLLIGLLTASMIVPAPVNAANAITAKTTKKAQTMQVGDVRTIKSNGNKADIKVKVKLKNKAITVKTSNAKVIKVKKVNKKGTAYKLYAKKAGKSNITIISKANKKLKVKMKLTVKPKKSVEKPVVETPEVDNKLTVSRKSLNTLHFQFPKNADISKLTKDSFYVKDLTGNIPVAIKDIKINSEDNSVDVELLIDMNDDSKYGIGLTKDSGFDYGELELYAKSGKISNIVIDTKTVPLNVEKKISFKALDASGVDITKQVAPFITLNVEIKSGKGYFDSKANKLTMFDLSSVAVVTATYQNGNEKVTATSNITVIPKTDATVSVDSFLITDASPVKWDKAATGGSATIALDDTSMNFYIRLKTSDGNVFASDKDKGFTVKSSDDSIFTMNGNNIVPKAKGTASIIVSYNYEGKSSQFTPVQITVGDKAVLNAFELSASSVEADSTNKGTLNIVNLKDQYGNAFNGTGNFTVQSNDNNSNAPQVTVSGNTITLTKGSAAAGTYLFKVSAKNTNVTAMFAAIIK